MAWHFNSFYYACTRPLYIWCLYHSNKVHTIQSAGMIGRITPQNIYSWLKPLSDNVTPLDIFLALSDFLRHLILLQIIVVLLHSKPYSRLYLLVRRCCQHSWLRQSFLSILYASHQTRCSWHYRQLWL